MVESTRPSASDNFFMLVHLGVGPDLAKKRPQKLEAKRQLLKKVLKRA